MARHIIHKQKVTVHIPRREDAHFFQNRISDMLQKELTSQIETMFDDLFPADKIIRIDSLKIDIGTINPQNFDREFKDEFIKALAKSLASKKNDLDVSNSNEVLSTRGSLINSFIYFLERGHLPWYSAVKNKADWETELLNDLSVNEYTYFLDWLKDSYRYEPVIMRRLIVQFSDSLFAKLLSAELPLVGQSWDLIYNDYEYILMRFARLKNLSQDDIRCKIWEHLFQVLLNTKDKKWASQILKQLFKHFSIVSSVITEEKKADINKKLSTTIVKNAFDDLIIFLKKRGEVPHQDETGKQDNGKELSEGWSKGKKQKWETEEEAIYVNNCGIVLLHSFLKPFFEDLDLVSKGKFTNENNWQRAVLLLHYLATGETEVAEFDLTLQKILCGYPVENTLPASIVLTPKENAEAKKLLNAVLSYWDPLKNTSIEGLRSSFLQRNGKLVKKDNGWQLIIEQKTVDILLGKLPWGFSTIRLPWMEEILSVDWY